MRVNRDDVLRVAPLEIDIELSFDAAVLKPFAQTGQRFHGGRLRSSPGGLSSIRCFWAGGWPREGAARHELLVLVFEALRPAAATELKVASFTLHGAAGNPAVVEPPGAY